MRAFLSIVFLSVLAFGCTTSTGDRVADDRQGIAELRVEAGPLAVAGVTRVTVEAGGVSQELVFNDSDSAYEGTLILPAGTATLVARAFNGDALVGQSQPTSVDITSDTVTRVFLQILDLRQSGPPPFGPIFDSLSFPTTVATGAMATLAISVIAPAGDPVTYAWASDCSDGTFTASDAATTGWSRPTQGVCNFMVVATSNGVSLTRNFAIVVLPASDSGAVDVSAGFVFAPSIAFQILGAGCFALDRDASCPTPIASPTRVQYSLSVFSWNHLPGTFTVSDNCGGTFFPAFQGGDFVNGQWLPPVTAGICLITARAVNGPGAAAVRGAAIIVQAGTAP